MPSVTDALEVHARRRPDALALVAGAQRWSWSELRDQVDQACAWLRTQGVRPGDRVALCAPDGAPAYCAALAVLRLGAVHVPVDHQSVEAEIAAVIDSLQTPWRLVPAMELSAWRLSATAWCELPRVGDPLGPGASAFIRYSSGTTGAAKGILLSHASLLARIACANRGLQLGPEDRVLWLLPMAYHFAVSILLYLQAGAAVVFGNSLRATTTAGIARAEQVTFAYGSPYQVRRLEALPPGEELPRSLRSMVSTTTALDAGAADAFRARHGCAVRQALGIIEIGLTFLSPGAPGEAPGELGQALPDVAVRILAPDGQVLPAGVPGELALRAPGMLDAYLAPFRPREAVLLDGYFKTGDAAQYDDQGRVRLLGRLKDLINVGGVKVFPLEVEAVLNAHPQVLASRVHGLPEARLGEQVAAQVQLRPGADPVAVIPVLQEWCRVHLATLKQPGLITAVAALPMTGSGKVRR